MLGRWHVHADGYAAELNNTPGCHVTKVWDPDADNAAAWAEKLGCESASVENILADPAIDGVVLCAATNDHGPLLLRAIEKAGYRAGDEVYLALDAAVSDWYTYGHGYRMPKLSKDLARAELCRHWAELSRRYPLLSIEDGMAEDDAEGWQSLTGEIGAATQLVGDDLFVTNPKRIKQGIEEKLANAVLIKPNQIGTLTETAEAIRMAKEAGFATILSHRSGETEDTTIADLAVAYGAGQIKAGAPCRGERTAKYNRLLRIEDELGGSARYAGKAVYGEKLKN